MRCKKCGAYINENVGICSICGGKSSNNKSLNVNEDTSSEDIKTTIGFQTSQFNAFKELNNLPNYKTEDKKDNSHLLIYLIIGFILLIIVVTAVLVYLGEM